MRRVFWILTWAATCAGPGMAMAANCRMNTSSVQIELQDTDGALPPSVELPGWRQLGPTRSVLVSLLCDADVPAVALRFANIVGVGGPLLRWEGRQPVGAMRIRALRATADGVPVELLLNGQPPAPQADIDNEQTQLALDLSKIGYRGRHFTLELEMSGFLQQDFRPIERQEFLLDLQVQMIDR